MGKCGRDDGSSKEGMIEAVCNEMKLGRQREGVERTRCETGRENSRGDGSSSFLAVQAEEQQKKIENQTCILKKECLHACCNLTA